MQEPMLLKSADRPLQETLRTSFALSDFRRGQREIIESVLGGKDVLAVLPTGGGKSLCFQLPAIQKQGLVVVISPLIALMRDQVSQLRGRGLRAGALHSGQSDNEKREIFREMSVPGPYLLYLSPERAQKEGFRQWIRQKAVTLFAIDEAHCVSQWGHDFREEYSQLNILKELRPDVPILALTASATPRVLSDISRQLALRSPERHVHGFYRKNLYYQVETCTDDASRFDLLDQALRQNATGRVIVYCGTRRATEELSTVLARKWEGVGHYHAGMSNETRAKVQTAYEKGDLRILVATNAFGMGIDHPDVRLVVHYQMPANIDSLYQEMGRAGRDGDPSTCVLLYARRDKGLQSYFITQSEASEAIKSSRWSALDALVDYAEGGECRHAEILTYYRDSQRIERCGHCDVCDPTSTRRVQKPVVSARGGVKTKTRKKVSSSDVIELNVEQEHRFELLREWRREKAKELDVPAFVVLSDRSLRDLASKAPSTMKALGDVHGFGAVKVERFGAEILRWMGFRS